MTNLEMVYKTMTIGLTSYLQSSGDMMFHTVLLQKRRRNFTQW